MPRSPGFQILKDALQRALFLERHPELKNALADYKYLSGDGSLHGRREFLKASIAVGAATIPLAALLSSCASAPKGGIGSISSEPPVVIIGGGLAGLTAAYRLSQAGVNCVLYEAQSRLGGRVFTKNNFNSEGMHCELGGEFIDSSHADLIGLASELGMKFDDFNVFDADVKKHQFFFGGKHYFEDDLTAACGPLAIRLLRDMKSVFKDFRDPSITYSSHSPEAIKFDRISLEAYLHGATDVDKWVRDAINIAYLTEFGLDTGEQPALNLMMLIDSDPANGFGIYGESDEAHRIQGGNSLFIEALVKAIEKKVTIHLEHALVRIEDKGPAISLVFEHGGTTQTVSSSRVLCALPFSTLRGVEGIRELPLSPTKHKCIAELGYGKNTKHILGFKERHWRMPLGSVPGANGYTFTDLKSQTLWDASRAQPGKSGIIITYLGGSPAMDPSRGVDKAILSDLEKIHPGTRSRYDGNRASTCWPTSYTCPRLGQYTTIIGSAKETELNGKLLFAGEHASERFQGYMNGAVQSANIASKSLIEEAGRSRAAFRRRESVEMPVT